jgi:hypothetical protein
VISGLSSRKLFGSHTGAPNGGIFYFLTLDNNILANRLNIAANIAKQPVFGRFARDQRCGVDNDRAIASGHPMLHNERARQPPRIAPNKRSPAFDRAAERAEKSRRKTPARRSLHGMDMPRAAICAPQRPNKSKAAASTAAISAAATGQRPRQLGATVCGAMFWSRTSTPLGDHYVPYLEAFDCSSGAARDWFAQYLL